MELEFSPLGCRGSLDAVTSRGDLPVFRRAWKMERFSLLWCGEESAAICNVYCETEMGVSQHVL